jgi:hypothetical protein
MYSFFARKLKNAHGEKITQGFGEIDLGQLI